MPDFVWNPFMNIPSKTCQTSAMILLADIPFCQAPLFFVEDSPFSFEIPDEFEKSRESESKRHNK